MSELDAKMWIYIAAATALVISGVIGLMKAMARHQRLTNDKK